MEDWIDAINLPEIRRIVSAAEAFMRDPRTSTVVRRQLLSFVQLIEAELQEVERIGQRGTVFRIIGVAQAAFAIGAIAGTPAMATHLRAGKHAAGGVKSGEVRRENAQAWQAHACDLMRDLRTQNPGWSREKVAIEALSTWRLQNVRPPESPRSLVDLLKKLETVGTIQPRELKRTTSFQKRASSLRK